MAEAWQRNSHNHGQPRNNLQHTTQIKKKNLRQNTHTNIQTENTEKQGFIIKGWELLKQKPK